MRKTFLILSAALAAVVCDSRAAGPLTTPEETGSSSVYAIRIEDAVHGFEVQSRVVGRMVDRLVMAVTGQTDTTRAWSSLVGPEDVVGIKISTDGGPLFSTHPAVVRAIAAGLRKAGVPATKIIVWDRDAERLSAAGYQQGNGYSIRNVEPRSGYDPEAHVSGAALGRLIWGDVDFRGVQMETLVGSFEESQLSTVSYLNRVLSQEVTKVINVPTMSTTSNVGIAGCLYNMTVRNVDNWRRFTSPPQYGDPFLAEMYFDERIGGKVVLNILDGLVAQYAGGPAFDPNYALAHATLYASKDPVAVDSIAARQINTWRGMVRLPDLGKRVRYLETAELYGLGANHPERINLEMLPR